MLGSYGANITRQSLKAASNTSASDMSRLHLIITVGSSIIEQYVILIFVTHHTISDRFKRTAPCDCTIKGRGADFALRGGFEFH
jgi:hypothetical protein